MASYTCTAIPVRLLAVKMPTKITILVIIDSLFQFQNEKEDKCLDETFN